MLDQEAITQQLALLATHRRTLTHLLRQAAQFGGELFAPPQTANGIAEAHQQILSIKARLHEGGVEVEDEPNDEALPASITTPEGVPYGLGSHIQATVTVQDNQGTVVGAQFNQPNWAVTSNVTNVAGNQQIIQPSLAPALHQLRAPIGDFVGRDQEIEQLVEALRKGDGAAISGVRGMSGIGKTELAYVVANKLISTFPDAQLIINLRGASANPLTPEAALQTVIHAFERQAQLPDELNELRNIYCSVLAGKRALILADNAKDAAQVRPLLPPLGCALLITSRNHFELPEMKTFDLRTLPKDEAEKLLLKISPRIGTDAPELARLCGYLPLALRVSASLLKSRPSRRVEVYLKHLGDERTKLAHLRDPRDPELDVAASLQLSYAALKKAAKSALCQLSVFPTSFNLDTAQSVVVMPPNNEIDTVLEDLCLLSLLEWDTAVQRYSLHDLVRAFAAGRIKDADAVRLRHARYFIKVAEHADNLFLQGRDAMLDGLKLFDLERPHIDSGLAWAQTHAGDADADMLLLAYVEATAFLGNLRYDKRRERIPYLEAALAAARRRGDRMNEGIALGNLGRAHADLGDVRTAILFYERALEVDRAINNRTGVGCAWINLGLAYYEVGDVQNAIKFYRLALPIIRTLRDRRNEANLLGNLGNAYFRLGDKQRAIKFYGQQLHVAHQAGDWLGEGSAYCSLGNASFDLGEMQTAIECYRRALLFDRALGNRSGEHAVLNGLGNVYAKLGDVQKAVQFYSEALNIARSIGDRRGVAGASWGLSRELAKQGHYERALGLMQVSVDYLREVGHADLEEYVDKMKRFRQIIAEYFVEKKAGA